MADSSIIIRLLGDTSSFDRQFRQSQRLMESFGGAASSLGTALTGAITVPLAGVGAAALQVAGKMEQNAIAFKTLLGSAEAATKHLTELRDFAARTPFEFDDLTRASRKMQALGFSAKEVLPNLKVIGDAAAGLGLGAEGIDRITLALGQMKAKGVVSAEEMRQLAEAGIPAWQILAKVLHTDVAGAMKAVEQRAVSSAQAVPELLAGMNAKFGGLMEAQSNTLLGQWSNFKDKMTFTLAEVGDALAPVAKDILKLMDDMGTKAKDAAKAFAALPEPIRKTSEALAGLLVATGPVLWFFGQVASATKNVMELTARLAGLRAAMAAMAEGAGGASVAVGLGVGAAAVINSQIEKLKSYQEAIKAQQKQQESLGEKVAKATGSFVDQRAAMVLGALAATTHGAGLKQVAEKQQDLTLKTKETRSEMLGQMAAMDLNRKSVADMVNALKDWFVNTKGVNIKWQETTDLLRDKDAWQIARDSIVNGAITLQAFSFEAFSAVDAMRKLIEPSETLKAIMNALSPSVMTLDKAFQTLGIQSQKSLEETKKKAQEAYDAIVDLYLMGGANAPSIADVRRAGEAKSKVEDAADPVKEPTKKIQAAKKELIQVSTVVTDLSRGLAKLIFEGGKFGDIMKKVGEDVAQSLLRNLLEKAMKPLLDAMSQLIIKGAKWALDMISKHIPAVAGALGKLGGIFGGGASAAGGAAGAAGSAAGSAGSAGSAAGSATSGITGAINMVSGIVTAAASVIQAFQLHGIGKDTGRMEESLRGILNVLALNGSESIHTFSKATMYASVGSRDYWIGTGHTMLVKISSSLEALVANTSRSAAPMAAAPGGVTISGGVFLANARDMDILADQLMARMAERKGFRG